MYRRYILPRFEIYGLKDEMGLNAVKTSRGEQEFAMYIKAMNPRADVQSAFTSKHPPRFARVRPDIYIGGDVNTVYNFHGCHTHIHTSPECPIAKSMGWIQVENPINAYKETYLGLREKEERHAAILEGQFGIPRKNIKKIWQCTWERIKTANLDTLTPKEKEWARSVRQFMTNFDKKHPKHRLAPREALRGGKTEAFRFFWEKALAPPGEELLYWDYNSLYPSVACYKYPVGKPTVLIKDDELARLDFDEEGDAFYVDDEGVRHDKVLGLLQCKLVCPQSLLVPYLSMRIEQKLPGGAKTEKSISPICSKCAETMSHNPCEHDEEDRSLVSCYTISEIGYAVKKLGYKLLCMYEAHIYTRSEYIFRDFLEPFAREKIINSGFPDDTGKTPESKQAYVDSVNQGMGWQEGHASFVNVGDIQNNNSQRSFQKLCQNALLG